MAIPILELVGGSLLVVGLFTRTTTFLLSLALGLVTFMATREVPLENGLVPFLMGMISMTFLFVGAGRLSLDYLIYLNRRAHHEREELNRFGRYVSR